MAIDFKKVQKDLYQPKAAPSVVNVPSMVYIAVDGKGDPNTSEEYAAAIEMLYGLSYTIKMGNKSVLEWVVGPLEGLWSIDGNPQTSVVSVTDKDKYVWTALIRQPDFVNQDFFETARIQLAKKKPNLDLSQARLQTIKEGLCVQILHVGPYDAEPETVAILDQFALDNGYILDLSRTRRHHEIYLSDPRRTSPDKLKTVIRHPIRRS